MAPRTQPLVLDVEQWNWNGYLDRAARWLQTATLLQATYRTMLEDTVDDIEEPHIRGWVRDMLAGARRHEGILNDLYLAFDPDRPPPGVGAAALLAKTREMVGHVEGLAGGARGRTWRKMRQLVLTNLDSTDGFAVTEQIGLALGLPNVVNLVAPVIQEKTRHQMVLRECLLEMATNAILYRGDI